MTRQEYIQREVEKVINEKLLPAIKDKHGKNEAIIPLVNGIAFFYSCGRLEPLQALCYLTNILINGEISNELKNLFKESEEV